MYSYAGNSITNPPQTATDLSGFGVPWTNPTGAIGSAGWASVIISTGSSTTLVPTTATSVVQLFGSWTNPINILSTSLFATCELGRESMSVSATISANDIGFALPSYATIQGIEVTTDGSISNYTGDLYVQLTYNGLYIGSAESRSLNGVGHGQTFGSSTDTWGATLNPSVVNGDALGLVIWATDTSGNGYIKTVLVNHLSVKIYYKVTYSDELQVATFGYSVPSTSGVSGFSTSFSAYASVGTTSAGVYIQLLKNGVPVGNRVFQEVLSTPLPYSLGGATDLWGTTWMYSDLNSTDFGFQIQAESTGGTVYVQNAQMTVYLTPSLANFNYIKTYEQNNNQTYTLALDADGLLWQENVTSAPNELSLVLSSILPGSFAKSATMDNREHICFSNLSIGTDRPRVYNGKTFDPLSQVGPGTSPAFKASTGSGVGNLTVTAYSLTSNVVEFVIDTVSPAPVVGTLYTITNVATYLNGNSYQVLATPAPTSTTFYVSLVHADDTGATGLTGTATPAYNYNISSITQFTAISCNGQELLWSAPGNPSTPGDAITVYYASPDAGENVILTGLLRDGIGVYVYFSTDVPVVGGGTYLVIGHGVNHPPGESAGVNGVPYIQVQYTSQGKAQYGGPGGSGPNGPGNDGTWQITLATVTTDVAITLIEPGDNFSITGVTPQTGWNGNWTVIEPVNNTTLDITSSAMSSAGVATYGWTIAVGTPTGVTAPTAGQLITVQGCTNSEVFNTTGVIASVTGTNSGTLTVDGFPPSAIASQTESATAVTFGTSFYFDPGINVAGGPSASPIYGNATSGYITIVGGALQPIGAGIRQGVVFFITENGYETAPGPPVTFTTSNDANYISASFIPIGPPNVISRGIAITEAGQNGVPGENFYVIEEPVVVNGINPQTYTSTIINDNTSTTAKFTFTDAVLLNSREIDVEGDDLFNLIELGSSAWCVPYHERMFYGLQLNKVMNFNNLTFDGGYLPNPGGNIQPLGWGITNQADQTLLVSTVTGLSLYIQNNRGGSENTTVGMITQTAYQDAYQVAIIEPAVLYSVRVACSAPSGLTTGTLTIDLYSTDQANAYGTFTLPLSSMTSNIAVYEGILLTTAFATAVPTGLLLRVYLANAGPLADCEIDRIEVFETLTPYLAAQVYGSYPGQPESIDGSATGGVIDTSTENAQACMGAFVMHDLLYLLKTNSFYSTSDSSGSEPGGWGLKEVSNKVGTVGVNSYDTGEEWAVTACRAGIFGFNGGQPVKIMQELWNLWECINWDAGNTIVLRNDILSKRLYCAIPLPTGTNPATGKPLPSVKWLPNAPYNPTPTTPNVMLMLNYNGLATFEEMIMSPGIHTTMFGTLAAPDMKRKWAIWNIATPDMEFILQSDMETYALCICNGIESSKIYQLNQNQYSDDGVAINSLYTTYGFVNAAKAATLPIFGFHRKLYTVLQCAITGGQIDTTSAGNAKVRILPNTLSPKYPYTVPVGIPLSDPVMDDFFRPINVAGNRMFVEFSTNAVGSWFNLSKMLLTGKADPHSTLNPTGGGNTGIV